MMFTPVGRRGPLSGQLAAFARVESQEYLMALMSRAAAFVRIVPVPLRARLGVTHQF